MKGKVIKACNESLLIKLDVKNFGNFIDQIQLLLNIHDGLLNYLADVVSMLHQDDISFEQLKKLKFEAPDIESLTVNAIAELNEYDGGTIGLFCKLDTHTRKLRDSLENLHRVLSRTNLNDELVEIEIRTLKIISENFNGAEIHKSNRLRLHEINQDLVAKRKEINLQLDPLLKAKEELEKQKAVVEAELATVKIKTDAASLGRLRYIQSQSLPGIASQLTECTSSIAQLQANLIKFETELAEKVHILLPQKTNSSRAQTSSISSNAATPPDDATTEVTKAPDEKNNETPNKPSTDYKSLILKAALLATCAIGLIFVAKKLDLGSLKLSEILSKAATLGRS